MAKTLLLVTFIVLHKETSYGIFMTWDLHFAFFFFFFPSRKSLELLRSFLVVPYFSPHAFLLFLLCCFSTDCRVNCLTSDCLSGWADHVLYSSSKQRPVPGPIYCNIYLSHYWTSNANITLFTAVLSLEVCPSCCITLSYPLTFGCLD